MGNRRLGREVALSALYGLEFNQVPVEDALGNVPEYEELSEPLKEFVTRLVNGVHTNLEELDTVIREFSRNWRLERMAVIDRNLLRLAAYEIIHDTSIPPKVSINEAIEISKKYGEKDSSAFINGILDKIAQTHRQPSE